MKNVPPFTAWTLLNLLLVLSCAAGARVWYIAVCTENGQHGAALAVQGVESPRQLPEGQRNRARTPLEFRDLAPLADDEELTAHIAPGYPWLLIAVRHYSESADLIVRWLQCVLGTLTAGCYFFFARRAFQSTFIATLTGLLIAFYPFWIVNTAELSDGVVTSFLLGVCLMLGTRGSQTGGAFTALFFGVALAGLAMVRAAFLPFSCVALLWFLWQCRRLSLGWFAGFLALLGFANGLAPWAVRNYFLFERPVPVATSTYLHLWMGNNPQATGATLDESALRASLPNDRLKELLDEPNQADRYRQLMFEVGKEIKEHSTETLTRRIDTSLIYVLGERWFKHKRLGLLREDEDGIVTPPDWVTEHAETILQATWLGMFLLALLGWRFSHAWRRYGRMATIAALMLPIPYVVSHAEALAGPRLPLDGVLLCFAAFALASMIPGFVRSPEANTLPKKGA